MAFTLTLATGQARQILTTLQSNLANLLPAMEQIRDILLESVQTTFEQGGRPTPWAPLRPPRTGTPLAGSGALRRSIVPVVTPTSVTLQSVLPYSAIQQYGGTVQVPEVRPRRGRALRWVGADGVVHFARRVRAHTVVLPPRPFLVMQDEDIAASVAVLETHVLQGT